MGSASTPDARRTAWLALAGTVAYLGVTGFFAARKLLWFDELFTTYIAGQPDTPRFVAALTSGGDTLPPGIHALVRLSTLLLGGSHLALRAPSILGYWLMIAAIFVYVRHRHSLAAATAAALVPLSTGAYWYAFEARPYALLAAASAWALVAWQRADGPARGAWLTLLWACTATALLLHWHAVLLIAIVLGAEAWRAWPERRPRAGVPIVLASAVVLTSPLLYPFFVHGLAFRGLIDPPDPLTFVFHAYELVIGSLGPFAVALLCLGVMATPDRAVSREDRADAMPALAYALLPVLTVVLAWITGSQALPRYATPAVIGFALLVGVTTDRLVSHGWRRTAWVGVLVAAVASNLVVQKLRLPDVALTRSGAREFALVDELRRPGDVRVIVPDGLAYIRFAYYAPDLTRRLVHVETPNNLGSRALRELAAHTDLEVRPAGSFPPEGEAIELYDVGFESPVVAALAARGLHVRAATESAAAASAYWQRVQATVGPAGGTP